MSMFRLAARVAAAMLLAFGLTACASFGKPVVMTQTFDPAAAAFINKEGKASISGQAFVRQPDGKVLRALGTDIYLVPRTAYADERFAAIYGSGDKPKWGVRVPDADPLYEQATRKTVATSGGSFRFERVADGNYYVVAMIFIPGGYTSIEFPIIERVTIANGRSARIVMRGY